MSEQIDALRSDLTAAGYRVDAVRALWGPEADAALHRGRRLPAIRALDRVGSTPVATLARLFLLGLPVSTTELQLALPSLGGAGAETLGLVSLVDDRAVPLLDLRPYSFADSRGPGEWWIASDLGELATGAPLRLDHVLGVGGASLTLAGLQLPGRARRALDLGTGSGIQALHAARGADQVVATDISARALELTRFNASLNELAVETRLGSLFEPVRGDRFDRMISNPPFVITPRDADVPDYEYRDGGLIGDGIVEAVVRGVGDVLTIGGIAQLLGNWEYRATEDGLDRVRRWVDASGLDAWVIEREQQDPSLYAETWIRDGGTLPGTPEFDALHEAWLRDFEARGVTGVGFGYLLLRRPDPERGVTLRRFERLHGALGDTTVNLGKHLQDCLDGHDWQVARDDTALLTARLAVAPDVTEQRHHWPGDADPAAMDLRQGGGFARTTQLDTALAAFVGACDGELAVGQIIAAIASLLDADEAALREDLLPRVRRLIDDAILLPTD